MFEVVELKHGDVFIRAIRDDYTCAWVEHYAESKLALTPWRGDSTLCQRPLPVHFYVSCGGQYVCYGIWFVDSDSQYRGWKYASSVQNWRQWADKFILSIKQKAVETSYVPLDVSLWLTTLDVDYLKEVVCFMLGNGISVGRQLAEVLGDVVVMQR